MVRGMQPHFARVDGSRLAAGGGVPLLVAVATALPFLSVVSGSFLNWDDDVNFLGNEAYRGLGPEQIRWAFTSVMFGHYIPLTRLTFGLNFVLGGMDPFSYHLLNVLVHALNAALFYLVARRLLAAASDGGRQERRGDRDVAVGAAVAALVFGVHPLRVEPVAWITGRADLLCGTFVLLATWAYLRAVEGDGAARRGFMLAATAALAGALLSKGVAVSVPAAWVLLDVYPLRRRRRGLRRLLIEKLPALCVALAAMAVILYAVRLGTVLTPSSSYGLAARVGVAAYSFVISGVRFFWPFALSPLHEMPARASLLEPRFALALAGAALLTIVLAALRRRWPGPLAAWTLSMLVLGPTSAAVKVTTDLAPDRHSYLAGLGFAALAGGGALHLIRAVERGALAPLVGRVAAAAGTVIMVALGATSWSYSEIWRHPESLWRWAIEVDETCAVCHSNLGQVLMVGTGGPPKAAEAEPLFRRAVALRPDHPAANLNLGTALMVQGRYAEAEAPLRRAIAQAPTALICQERLGSLYLLQKRYDEAIPLLRGVLTRAPHAVTVRGYLIEALRGRALALQTTGLAAQAEPLLAESRALERDVVARPP